MSKITQAPVPKPFRMAFEACGIKIKKFKTAEGFERDLKKFLKRNHVLHLSTTRDGQPRSTPLEYRLSGLTLYILSEGGVKFENLKRNKKISFSIAEPYDSEKDYWSYKGVQAWATANVIDQKKHPQKFKEALKKMRVTKTLKNLGMKELPPGINYRIIEINADRLKYSNPREGVFRITWKL